MSAFTFRHLTLAEAEEQIVGGAIEHEHALVTALEVLPPDFFRSERADELRQVFYVVAGWYSRGEWDRKTNGERLERYFPCGWIDDLWWPWAVIPEYVRDLCEAVVESNRLADAAVTAARDWRERNPLARSEQEAAAVKARPAARRAHQGGVQIDGP